MNPDTCLHFRQDDLIAESYVAMAGPLCRFIASRIGNAAEAEDLTQEIFARLLEYNALLSAETLPRFLYRMARNLITDHFRRHACRKSAAEYFARFTPAAVHNTEEQIAANDLLRIERQVVGAMPRRKASVYALYIYDDFSAADIAAELQISRRTVENHIFSARCELRKALAGAI